MSLRKILLFLILASLKPVVFGQVDSNYHWVEEYPKFKGGDAGMFKIISDSMIYPKAAIKDNIGGKIITQFTIDTSGNVTKIEIVKGIREDLDNEAKRLIGLLNAWTPGSQNGKKVKVTYKLVLYFYPNQKFKRRFKKENNLHNQVGVIENH